MKKLYLFLAALAVSVCTLAQQNQVVWQNGRAMYASPVPSMDSITFSADVAEMDTLHLLLPRTLVQVVHDTVVLVVRDTIYRCPSPAPLAGVFSVSATKQVRFSQGNLQYKRSADTWYFAENQYDMIGFANVDNGALADKIDLFGWSGDAGSVAFGIGISEAASDYAGAFQDWGTHFGNGVTWRTMTQNEWEYLLEKRTNAASLKGVARIDIHQFGFEYANGLILLPDSWSCPGGITFNSGMGTLDSDAYATQQTFTLEQWKQLEAAGAVFLPAAGFRSATGVGVVQWEGAYWSATSGETEQAGCMVFFPNEAEVQNYSRSVGNSVRLVQEY